MNTRVFDGKKQVLTADEEEQWEEEMVETDVEDIEFEE